MGNRGLRVHHGAAGDGLLSRAQVARPMETGGSLTWVQQHFRDLPFRGPHRHDRRLQIHLRGCPLVHRSDSPAQETVLHATVPVITSTLPKAKRRVDYANA